MEGDPMKCIISKSGKTIERVKEDVASKKVASGKWNYCSKEKWKESVRPKVDEKAEAKTVTKKKEKAHGLKAKDRKKANKK